MVAPVAVDAMGGDYAPLAVIKGAIDSIRLDASEVILVGDTAHISDVVAQLKAADLILSKKLTLIHAASSVSMAEKPSTAMRIRDSSMRLACDLVARGEACGALSAGNSGAMMAIAVMQIGRLDGVIRPAIATLMPSHKGFSIVADAGANVDCTPQMLAQFAIFGAAFAKGVFGTQRPRVAVLSNGEEESKGTELTRAALELIRATDLLCEGYCEGRDIFAGHIDVAVCDGFTGNVLLKTAEGTANYFAKALKDNISNAGPFVKLGALLLAPVFAQIKKRLDSREYGAAPLLGLKAPVFIAHGNSDAYAMRRAIDFVRKSHQGHVAPLIEGSLAKNNDVFKARDTSRES